MSEGEQRKLTAIMFTDLVGYSALAQRNESLALELLEEHRRLLRPLFPKHHGREVETAGDAFLVEFSSALAAVRCAVEIQECLAGRNRMSPPERAIHLRIGVHVGDVVHKDGKVMGDAVNIAARIQPLAKAGGICVSNAVFEQVQNKLDRRFASLGVPELKNIKLPVTVHRVIMPGEDATSRTSPGNSGGKSRGWMKVALPTVIIAVVAGLWVWQSRRQRESAVLPAPVAAAPLSEARKLAQQARALIDDDPLAVRENYRLAEEFGQRAVQLDPTDADAWATLARASLSMVAGRYDDTPARRESARGQAERAIRLAPDSLEAGLAMAGYLLVSRQFADAEKRARELLRRFPDNPQVLALLAESLDRQGRSAETHDLLRQHTNTPAGLVLFRDWEAYDCFDRGALVEADSLLDQLFAAKPTANSYLTRLLVDWTGWGDLPAASAFLEKIPSQLLLEDAFAHHAAYVWMELGQTEKALEALRRIPRDFLEEKRVVRPKGLVAGRVLQAAGRTAAAEVEWRQALALVDKRLATEPGRADWVRLKALLLAYLGQKADAQKQLTLWQEMSGAPANDDSSRSIEIQMALGNREEAIRGFQSVITPRKGRWLSSLNVLRHDPLFAPIRSDVRVQDMIAKGEDWLKSLHEAAARTSSAAATAADQKSIAVLAFANLSDDKANEYFSDGISEELLNVLSKVPGLKVSARTSAFSFKGRNVPIPEIAQQLGVAYVVEGSVRKAGDKVRITAQLIKATDGFHVWSDTFTRDLKDVFAVQDEIAGLIAQNLSLKLGAGSPKAPVDPEVFRLYLAGRKEWSQRTETSLASAEKLFTQAIALDPNFARAHAGLADVWMIRADQLEREGKDATKEYEQGAVFLDRALQLDPELAEAWATRGNYLLHKEKFLEAEQAFQRALALNPNYASAHQWYGRLLFTLGKIDAGLGELELATRLDPLSPIIMSNYGMFLGFARRWPESLAVCDRALAIQPDFEQALGMRAYALAYLGRSSEALTVARATFKSLATNAPPDPNGNSSWIKLLAAAGDRANAARLAAPILAANPEDSSVEVFSLFLAVNRPEDGFAYLERNKSRLKQSELCYLLDPTLDSVREDPRFLSALREGGHLKSYQDIWAQYVAWKNKSGQQ
ncbi:MAG: adenylate/guanylate cyclase domain-containing protein [Verrucomicrobiota bacterium]